MQILSIVAAKNVILPSDTGVQIVNSLWHQLTQQDKVQRHRYRKNNTDKNKNKAIKELR